MVCGKAATASPGSLLGIHILSPSLEIMNPVSGFGVWESVFLLKHILQIIILHIQV